MKTWILFISFIPTVLLPEVTFLHSANKLTYDDAVKYCKLQGQYFLPDDVTNSTQLVKYMDNQGITSVWLALKKKTLECWTWTNGAHGSRPFLDKPHRACAGLSAIALKIRAMRCNYGGEREGFICENQGNVNCSGSSPGEYCFSFGKSSFTFQCGISDWYTAEVRCCKKGQMLAVLDNSDKVKAFVNEKNKHYASISLCNFYWVGLRKEDWTAVTTDKNVMQIKDSYWANEQPRPGMNCSIASFVKGRIQWTARQCIKNETTVCVIQPGQNSPSVPSWLIPLLLGVGTTSIFLVLIVAAAIFYLKKRHNPTVIPENTVKHCKRLDTLIQLSRPISIYMVMTSDREEHMNRYLARDCSTRENIESRLQSVLPSYYKGILGLPGKEAVEEKLTCLNNLKTERFLVDSSNEPEFSSEMAPHFIIIETNGKTVNENTNATLSYSKNKTVLITRARQSPGDLRRSDVISVGLHSKKSGEWCAYGDKPHILVYTDYYKHKLHLNTQGQPEPHEIAALYTALNASLVMMLASSKGWSNLEGVKLESTNVMRQILRRMCSHPDQMTDKEGYGVLNPWPFLLDWDKMKAVLDKVVKDIRHNQCLYDIK